MLPPAEGYGSLPTLKVVGATAVYDEEDPQHPYATIQVLAITGDGTPDKRYSGVPWTWLGWSDRAEFDRVLADSGIALPKSLRAAANLLLLDWAINNNSNSNEGATA